MSGRSKWQDIKHKATPEQLTRARRQLTEELTLAELRRARDMTQASLANSLGMTQPGVSRIEAQTDVYLSTLRSYVEALGGSLDLLAVFPDGAYPIKSLEELDADLRSEAKRAISKVSS